MWVSNAQPLEFLRSLITFTTLTHALEVLTVTTLPSLILNVQWVLTNPNLALLRHLTVLTYLKVFIMTSWDNTLLWTNHAPQLSGVKAVFRTLRRLMMELNAGASTKNSDLTPRLEMLQIVQIVPLDSSALRLRLHLTNVPRDITVLLVQNSQLHALQVPMDLVKA
jgi:hypothetical protein